MSNTPQPPATLPAIEPPPAMTDGARMVPAKTNAYWEELRAYWRRLGPDAAREAVVEAHRADERKRGQPWNFRPDEMPAADGPSEDGRIGMTTDFIHALKPLPAGSEAAPFLDEERGVVYKLFTPSPAGNVGWRLRAARQDGKWRVDREPAQLMDTAEKLSLIHAAGGLPTEIVGLTTHFDLVGKQPLAFETEPGMATRANAVAAMNGVQIADADFHGLRVLWVDGEAWLMGDLHAANIMRDAHGQDRVIDALFMRIPSAMIAENEAVRTAVSLARRKTEGPANEPQGELFA